MSTESARKAAEQLWDIKYGLRDDWVEKATPIIAAACQTVAPQPDLEAITVKWAADTDREIDPHAFAAFGKFILEGYGAAPAVSTPPSYESEVMPPEHSGQSVDSAIAASSKTSGLAVSKNVVTDEWRRERAQEFDKKWWTDQPLSATAIDDRIDEMAAFAAEMEAAVSTPRCPKCGDNVTWNAGDKYAVCDRPIGKYPELSFHQFEIKSHSDFAQFFQPAPSPPQHHPNCITQSSRPEANAKRCDCGTITSTRRLRKIVQEGKLNGR